MRARLMLRAAVFPFLVKASRFLRSSSVSVTRYFFWFIDFPRCCSFSLLFGVRLPSNYSIHAGQPSCTDVLSTIRSTLGEALAVNVGAHFLRKSGSQRAP